MVEKEHHALDRGEPSEGRSKTQTNATVRPRAEDGPGRLRTCLAAIVTVGVFLALWFCAGGPKGILAGWYPPIEPYLKWLAVIVGLMLFARIVVRPRYQAWKQRKLSADAPSHPADPARSRDITNQSWPDEPETPAEHHRRRRAVAVMLGWVLVFLATPIAYQFLLTSFRVEAGRREFERAGGTLRVIDGQTVLFFQEPRGFDHNLLSFVATLDVADSLDVLDLHEPPWQGEEADFNVRAFPIHMPHYPQLKKCFRDVSPLAGLRRLKQLDLQFSDVTDLTPLSGLTALTHLNVGFTPVADVSPLSRLRDLKELNLVCTKVADISPLSGFTSLRKLSLFGTKLTDFRRLADLTALLELSLASTGIRDLSPLGRMSALTELNIEATPVSDLSPISGLPSLQRLYVGMTGVANLRPLARLTSLQDLRMWRAPVTDISPLSGLTDLRVLVLAETQVMDLSPLSGLARLEILSLSGTGVTDLSPLSDLSQLRVLELADCKGITDAALDHLDGCKRLRELNTAGTKITAGALRRFLESRESPG